MSNFVSFFILTELETLLGQDLIISKIGSLIIEYEVESRIFACIFYLIIDIELIPFFTQISCHHNLNEVL